MKTQKLYHLTIQVPKGEAAFFYFSFEAHDNLCFYSTLKSPPSSSHRQIALFSPLSLKKEMAHLLNQLQKQSPFEILREEIFEDHPQLMEQFKNAQ